MPKIPVTVFTGYLGSGKTTIIRNLVQKLPADYQICLLKNEFGDIAVDSLLLQDSNIKVTEMLNGCLCCVLVGKMDEALKEMIAKYHPQRIIIETSGSAYPAPIALEIQKLKDVLVLDGIITVIDVLNFTKYQDISYTAKIQAKFTDLILLNKVELVNSIKLDQVIDAINELNSEAIKIELKGTQIDPNLIFGIDTHLPQTYIATQSIADHQHQEADMLIIKSSRVFELKQFVTLITELPKWDFIRIKGLVILDSGKYLLNYVFGRYTLEPFTTAKTENEILFLGKNFAFHQKKISKDLMLNQADYQLTLRELN